MANLYETLDLLCKNKGVKGGRMCADLGISKSLMTDLKSGRKKTINAETAQKIAEYFGVTTDFLLYGENRTSNTVNHVSGSTVVQGNSGCDMTVVNGNTALDASETELLRVFRSLDMKGKTAVLSCAYEQEERLTGK